MTVTPKTRRGYSRQLPTNIRQFLAYRLSEHRFKLGISVAKAAQLLDVGNDMLTNWEHGLKLPQNSSLLKLNACGFLTDSDLKLVQDALHGILPADKPLVHERPAQMSDHPAPEALSLMAACLKAGRRRCNLKRKQVAAIAGVHVSAVGYWETGVNLPRWDKELLLIKAGVLTGQDRVAVSRAQTTLSSRQVRS